MPPKIPMAKSYADVDKFIGKARFRSPISTESHQKLIAEFEKIKAGH